MNGLEWFMIIISIIFFFIIVGYYMSSDKESYKKNLSEITVNVLGGMLEAMI